jgi:hypothetical protein
MHDRDRAKPLDPEQAKPLADVLDQLTEVRDPADAAEDGDLESIPWTSRLRPTRPTSSTST